MTRLALFALLALSVAGCPSSRVDDDDLVLPDDDDDDVGDDDDSAGDDDDSTPPNGDGDGDGSPTDVDCDDADPANYPGNVEICDGQDNDCDADTTIVEVAFEAGPGTSSDLLGDVFAGNAWRVDADVVLSSFGQRLTAVAGQGLQWLVFEGPSVGGPYVQVAATTTSVDAADAGVAGYSESGPLDLPLTAGNVYVLGIYGLGTSTFEVEYGVGAITPVSFGALLGGVFGQGDGLPPGGDALVDSIASRHPQRVTIEADDDADGDGVPACAGDCNDGQASAQPGGVEQSCDFIDNDCDASTRDCDGGLIITEIFVDAFGSDADQEWFEVFNDSGAAIDLGGWLIIDDGGEDEYIEGSVMIDGGARAVFADNADSTVNGGVAVDVEYGGAISLSNAGDELRLISPLGEEVDGVAWDASTHTIQEGAALNLDPGALDATSNDDPSNWCASLAPPFEGNSTGTPGTANASCMVPASGAVFGDLVITETLQDPDGADANKEWFELRNTTGAAISLLGWTFSDLATDSFGVTQAIVVPANGYIVLGETTTAADNGGAPVSYGYGGNMTLGNEEDELIVTSPEGIEIDRVEWDGGPLFPDPVAATMSLHPGSDATDNDDGDLWCASSAAAFGTNGDLGSPGAANPACPQ